jgi:hypothetical protein
MNHAKNARSGRKVVKQLWWRQYEYFGTTAAVHLKVFYIDSTYIQHIQMKFKKACGITMRFHLLSSCIPACIFLNTAHLPQILEFLWCSVYCKRTVFPPLGGF